MKISQFYPLQLEIEFPYCDEESDLLKRADDIIQKYLRLYDKAFRQAYTDNDRRSSQGQFIEKVCHKGLCKLISSADRMLHRLNLPLSNFAELERMYNVYPNRISRMESSKEETRCFRLHTGGVR